MAKKGGAAKKNEGQQTLDQEEQQPAAAESAEASSGSAALALPDNDELAGVLDDADLATDGLEEVDQDDIKIPVKVFNMKGQDQSGDPIPPNRFYDTITEELQKDVDAVLLTLHKTNEWREYDEEAGESKIRCRSFDRVTGTMDDGTTRPCKGCPDAQWKADENGKRTRRCSPVYNFVGVERLTQQPFILRCKKTSLPPAQRYLSKHFIGRRVTKGKRGNYPLFAFGTHIGLKMGDKSGNYAVPVFERGDVLSAAEIKSLADQAKFYRESVMPVLEKVSDQDVDAGGGSNGGDGTDFNPDDFADDGAPPAAAEGVQDGAAAEANRF